MVHEAPLNERHLMQLSPFLIVSTLQVRDCALMLGLNSVWCGGLPWGLTVHSHLSLDRLYVNVNITTPLYTLHWARRYLHNVMHIYRILIEGDENMSVAHVFRQLK